MNENVHEWKVVSGGTILGQVLTFNKDLVQTKITSKALDGTVYIQTVGAPTSTAKVSVLSSPEERDLLNDAEASGSIIEVTYRHVKYAGYIESKLEWQTVYPGKWYNAEMVLLIEGDSV